MPDQEDEPEPEEGVSNVCPVSNSTAAYMFEKCLTWLEYQPEVNQYNACTLRELHALAVRKRGESLKQMTLLEFATKVNVCMSTCAFVQCLFACISLIRTKVFSM